MGTSKHIEALRGFLMNDMTPFSGTATDIAIESIESAHALSTILAQVIDPDASDGRGEMNPAILREGVEGIATLIALAGFALCGGFQERRS